MATIEQRNGSYRITVSCGYNSAGKQIKKRMTWTPKPNMTRRQIEKELDRQAVLFEEKCQTGQFLDGNITLAEFSERWFNDYAL
ncbi:MAG: site-specific integrase, partial [Clostridia bacterium]|nr:site-specific integrase [Clostridia bacterium]